MCVHAGTEVMSSFAMAADFFVHRFAVLNNGSEAGQTKYSALHEADVQNCPVAGVIVQQKIAI